MARGKKLARIAAFGAVIGGAVVFWRKRRDRKDNSAREIPAAEVTTPPSTNDSKA
jgi:hypothetical protein